MTALSYLTKLSAPLSLVSLGLVVIANTPAGAQTNFPDVSSDYWAQPFIQRLAERNIVVGYPDGTFRPEQPVDRDEFAAMIRKAFEKEPIRQIESGSVYKDVPEGYWAAPAIEEAYQQGFMSGYAGNVFRPQQPVSRVEALVTLVQGLNLAPKRQAITPAPQRQVVKRPLYLPFGIFALMQPLVIPKATAAAPATTPPPPRETLSALVSNYYTDAQKVPQYAIEEVGIATQKNIVVNHPDPRVLNPNQPLRRATATAFIHQTLVAQDRIEPLSPNVAAYNYIVRPGVSQAAR
ncbi:S-layer homology domain-containing protein [Anabaena sp. 4-3]|uniref:S-layer homology domain-containing protein n=1 Tax=Anabaena sp. 4-3 TaxID=1811979 RepID=UPI00082D8F06|nr:S-layer homology domain-containing protein [Anabaena sp. 4-3]